MCRLALLPLQELCLRALPPVLVILLERFAYHEAFHKLEDCVAVSATLSLPSPVRLHPLDLVLFLHLVTLLARSLGASVCPPTQDQSWPGVLFALCGCWPLWRGRGLPLPP